MNRQWPSVKLGEVLRLDLHRVAVDAVTSYPMVGVLSFGRGLFDREPVQHGNTSYRVFYELNADHIVMSQLFGWEGALALSSEEFAGKFLSPQFPTFLCDEARLDRSFLGWMMRRPAFWADLGSRTSGMGDRRRTLNPEALFACDIMLPPLADQRRIVMQIEELATQIKEARSLRRQAVEEAEALSYASLRDARHQLLDSPHPKFRLGTLAKVTSGGTPSRSNAAFWDGNIPWIKTGELLDDDIASAEEHITQAGVENSSARLFPPDTVLIALYGQGQTRGRTGRLLISATTNQACCAILPEPEKFEPRFIQFWLRSLYIELREVAQGGAQPNWNGGMIKDLIVALPPLSEQRRIVAELDALQAELHSLRCLQAETAAELHALLPSVLSKAFAREL